MINGSHVQAVIRSAASRIQEITPSYNALDAFFSKYPHRMVAKRRREAIEAALEGGRVLLAEVPQNGSRKIAGCAMQYDLCEAKYVEIGSIRVPGAAGLGGFDIQDIFIAAAVFNLLAEKVYGDEGEHPAEVFATIHPENYGRQHPKFQKVGLIEWENPPSELLAEKKHTVLTGAKDPKFYRFDENFLPNIALFLKQLGDGSYRPARESRANPSVDEILHISFELFVFRQMGDLMDKLAGMATFEISSAQ